MLQEFYSLYVPLAFAVISALVKYLSKRKDDQSPLKNDLCMGQALLLGAISASAAFAVNAQITLQRMIEEISRDPQTVTSAIADKTQIVSQARTDWQQIAKQSEAVSGCIGIIVLCIMLVLALAVLDKQNFSWIKKADTDQEKKDNIQERTDNIDQEKGHYVYERSLIMGLIVPNVIGLMSFVAVFLYTKPFLHMKAKG